MLSLILSTFRIVFIAELPHKTALASLVLATQYRVRDVVAGAWLAFLVQTAVAIVAGGLLHLLPARPVQIASGVGFLVFALLALRRKAGEQFLKEEDEVARERRRRHFAWLTNHWPLRWVRFLPCGRSRSSQPSSAPKPVDA
jgi:uncharacterized membrane protein